MSDGISIMDLGLNEFRLDLLDYMKRNGDMDKKPLRTSCCCSGHGGVAGGCDICSEKHQQQRQCG